MQIIGTKHTNELIKRADPIGYKYLFFDHLFILSTFFFSNFICNSYHPVPNLPFLT